MDWDLVIVLLMSSFIAWEIYRETPKPYPLGNGDTLMVRITGYEFCPQYCKIDHFHTGHKKKYDCGVDTCTHIIYEDRLN